MWSPRADQLAWHDVHNRAFRRLEGIPATVRVDNTKTAVSRGAGAWGELNPSYRRYARAVRFHIDACPIRHPQAKGVEWRTSKWPTPVRVEILATGP